MNFRVYITLEIPILDKKYEMLVPIDRRIHDVITILKNYIPELNENYYKKYQNGNKININIVKEPLL